MLIIKITAITIKVSLIIVARKEANYE